MQRLLTVLIVLLLVLPSNASPSTDILKLTNGDSVEYVYRNAYFEFQPGNIVNDQFQMNFSIKLEINVYVDNVLKTVLKDHLEVGISKNNNVTIKFVFSSSTDNIFAVKLTVTDGDQPNTNNGSGMSSFISRFGSLLLAVGLLTVTTYVMRQRDYQSK